MNRALGTSLAPGQLQDDIGSSLIALSDSTHEEKDELRKTLSLAAI